MKKIISLSLVAIMVLSMSLFMASCGGNDDAAGGEEETSMTVTMVVADGFGDKSFYDSSKDGLDRLATDIGITAKTVECKGENFEQQMRNAADVSDVVIPVGFQFSDIDKVAADYPDKKFIWIDNATETTLDNLLCITYAQNQGSFLAGYIAAELSETGIIGVVGGDDSATINDFIVGYEQGAKYADKDVKVLVNHINDFVDAAKGKEAATSQHDKGADVIFQVAGNAGSGVFQAAKEGGFLAIGVDTDQKWVDPEVIAFSMIKNAGQSIYDVVKDYVENEKWEGNRVWVADMAGGYIGIGYGEDGTTQQVNDDIKAKVDELMKDIADGKIEVKTTRG
ncbi:basic membrane protein A [Clostridiales Family XIII bacterium PM5-7]